MSISDAANKKAVLVKRSSRVGLFTLVVAILVLVSLQWTLDEVVKGQLVLEVRQWAQWDFLESKWTYFYLHLFTFIPVFVLSFDKKVAYYRAWKHLFPAIALIALVFIGWDIFFTEKEVWGFNETYLSGLHLFNLPIEEVLFFFTVPFACVFIYECLNAYISKDLLATFEHIISWTLVLLFFGLGFWKFWHMYTATTFLLAGGFLLGHKLWIKGPYRSRFFLAYAVSWIPFILVNGVLTGGFTREPVVIYNPDEYFGFRIGSVPIDDSIYSFLLLFSVVTIYEGLKNEQSKRRNQK